MSFLPKDYEIPQAASNYMKLEQGTNQFRVLSSPILGNEYWVEEDGKRKPIRVRLGETIDLNDVPEPDKIKHFWAFVVLDRADNKIKILELTQKSLQRSLRGLSQDEDWGDPKGTKGYDIVITREGEKLETKYELNPKPHKKLEDGVEALYKDMNINLEALFDGDDPFESQDVKDIKDVLGIDE